MGRRRWWVLSGGSRRQLGRAERQEFPVVLAASAAKNRVLCCYHEGGRKRAFLFRSSPELDLRRQFPSVPCSSTLPVGIPIADEATQRRAVCCFTEATLSLCSDRSSASSRADGAPWKCKCGARRVEKRTFVRGVLLSEYPIVLVAGLFFGRVGLLLFLFCFIVLSLSLLSSLFLSSCHLC